MLRAHTVDVEIITKLIRERKISPKFLRPKFFHGRPHGMSVQKCLFFQDLEGLTEVFGRMCAGISGPKLPLWAEFSFLINSPDNFLCVAEVITQIKLIPQEMSLCNVIGWQLQA